MRLPILMRAILLLCSVAMPALMRAQFQAPTADELKMTDDPKAPGAAAVYLYREEKTDDGNHFNSYYERIKVLTEKGKELATVRIPYVHGVDVVTDVQGRTIHADGTIVPLAAKPSDLMEFKAKQYQVNTLVFTLPSVEVGSILEYRVKVRAPDYRVSEPVWDIQLPYFIHQAHFSFHAYLAPGHYITDATGQTMTRLMYSSRLPEAKVVRNDNTETYTVDLTDVPATPAEDWMPPLNTLRWRVDFYYTNATSGPNFWQDAGKHWSHQANEFANPTSQLKKATAELVASTDTDEQKARKLYAAVQKLDNTDFSRTKSESERKREKLRDIRNAEDVWTQKSGSADDMALLYVALARAAGLKAFAIQVVNRDRAIFDTHYLAVKQLDDYLAIVVLDGKDVYLDPGQKMCPFGALHWKHTLASGFRQTEKEAAPVATPSLTFKSATVHRVADLSIESNSALTGTVRLIMSGPEALRWRQLSVEADPDEVKKQFDEAVQSDFPDGVEAELDRFIGLDDYDANLTAILKVSGTLGSATGKHVFLPGLFFQSHTNAPFVAQDKRSAPVDVHYPRLQTDDVIYHLPAGLKVESTPQPATAEWPSHAILKIATQPGTNAVGVTRSLAYGFTLLEARDYSNLHDFYQKVATADQQQIVLTRAQTATGN
jgi:hypothetical protein